MRLFIYLARKMSEKHVNTRIHVSVREIDNAILCPLLCKTYTAISMARSVTL